MGLYRQLRYLSLQKLLTAGHVLPRALPVPFPPKTAYQSDSAVSFLGCLCAEADFCIPMLWLPPDSLAEYERLSLVCHGPYIFQTLHNPRGQYYPIPGSVWSSRSEATWLSNLNGIAQIMEKPRSEGQDALASEFQN